MMESDARWRAKAGGQSTAVRLATSLILVAWFSMGCRPGDELHEHSPGQHGGIVVPLGRDHYHAEALFADGELHLFMLGQDDTQVAPIESQEITAYVRTSGDASSHQMQLKAAPQAGDPEGQTSRFVGQMPPGLKAGKLIFVVPMMLIEGQQYRFSFLTSDPVMPAKVTDQEEVELYLTAGGLYTKEDIEANGGVTASVKYKDFRSAHDMHPQAGDRICPVTATKANAACTWIIGGEQYQFCCPPCVDEFLARAKTDPQSIKPPKSYTQP